MRALLLVTLLLLAAAALAWRPAGGQPPSSSGEACATPPRDFPSFVRGLGAARPPLDLEGPRRLETATFALG